MGLVDSLVAKKLKVGPLALVGGPLAWHDSLPSLCQPPWPPISSAALGDRGARERSQCPPGMDTTDWPGLQLQRDAGKAVKKGDYDEAAELLEEALARVPRDVSVMVELGKVRGAGSASPCSRARGAQGWGLVPFIHPTSPGVGPRRIGTEQRGRLTASRLSQVKLLMKDYAAATSVLEEAQTTPSNEDEFGVLNHECVPRPPPLGGRAPP